jgi:hypothetical protein
MNEMNCAECSHTCTAIANIDPSIRLANFHTAHYGYA